MYAGWVVWNPIGGLGDSAAGGRMGGEEHHWGIRG